MEDMVTSKRLAAARLVGRAMEFVTGHRRRRSQHPASSLVLAALVGASVIASAASASATEFVARGEKENVEVRDLGHGERAMAPLSARKNVRKGRAARLQ